MADHLGGSFSPRFMGPGGSFGGSSADEASRDETVPNIKSSQAGIAAGILAASRYPPPERLLKSDFSTEHILHVEGCRVRCQAPAAFAALRRARGVSEIDWIAAWVGGVASPRRSDGKSGASFVFSSDERFIVKSLHTAEALKLLELLPAAFNYWEQHPGSLINRPLALLSTSDGGDRGLFWVVLENLLPEGTSPSMLFDLKGSTQGRSGRDKANQSNREKVPVLKDNDFRDMDLHVRLSPQDSAELQRQLRADTEFLTQWQLMDYSLLLGIEVRRPGDPSRLPPCLCSLDSTNGRYRYYFGIIDYLQEYNTKKKLAGMVKAITADKDALSTVPPGDYAARFGRFMEEVVFRVPPAEGDASQHSPQWMSVPNIRSRTAHFGTSWSGFGASDRFVQQGFCGDCEHDVVVAAGGSMAAVGACHWGGASAALIVTCPVVGFIAAICVGAAHRSFSYDDKKFSE